MRSSARSSPATSASEERGERLRRPCRPLSGEPTWPSRTDGGSDAPVERRPGGVEPRDLLPTIDGRPLGVTPLEADDEPWEWPTTADGTPVLTGGGDRPRPAAPDVPSASMLRAEATRLAGATVFEVCRAASRREVLVDTASVVVWSLAALGSVMTDASYAATVFGLLAAVNGFLLARPVWRRVRLARAAGREAREDLELCWVTVLVTVTEGRGHNPLVAEVWDGVLEVDERERPTTEPDRIHALDTSARGWHGWDAVPAWTRGAPAPLATYRPVVGAPMIGAGRVQPLRKMTVGRGLWICSTAEPGDALLAASPSAVWAGPVLSVVVALVVFGQRLL